MNTDLKRKIFDEKIMKLIHENLNGDEFVRLCELLHKARYEDVISSIKKLKRESCIQKVV